MRDFEKKSSARGIARHAIVNGGSKADIFASNMALFVELDFILSCTERVGFGLWGESCSILFSREAGEIQV